MWRYVPETEDDFAALVGPDGGAEALFQEGSNPDKDTCDLWAEALNVQLDTGLTPAQLQARVAELEGALAAEAARLLHLRGALISIASGEIIRSHCVGDHCMEELGVSTAEEMASRAGGALDWDTASA